MGLSSRKPADARRGHGPGRRDDPAKARWRCWRAATAGRPHLTAGLLLLALLLHAAPLRADPLRIATWNVELDRRGPGLMLRDIAGGEDAQVQAVLRVLVQLRADVLLLTGVDHDHGLQAGRALADALRARGRDYPHLFAPPPNTGIATGLDLDGDGDLGGAGDAQGWGRFAGQGAMLVLSRLPVDGAAMRDFSGFLWRDLPGAILPPGMTEQAMAVQRLATTAHAELPLILPGGGRLNLLVFHATPPVFDGPEDRNGRRNHDEAAFWLALLDGRLPFAPPVAPFVLLGDSNLDPADGDGRRAAIRALLAHPALQDPRPAGQHGRRDTGHAGDPGLDTAWFEQTGGVRVDLVLPAAGLVVTASGVLMPPAGDPLSADLAADLATASRHAPVWVDLALP